MFGTNSARGCKGTHNQSYCPGATRRSNSSYYFDSGYAWYDIATYHPNVDSQKYGSCWGAIRQLISGGDWGTSINSGFRSINSCNFPTRILDTLSTRGCKKNVSSSSIILGRRMDLENFNHIIGRIMFMILM